MSATVVIDQTVHTFSCQWIPRSFREGGDLVCAGCSCGWRGTPGSVGSDVCQWNQHVGVGK